MSVEELQTRLADVIDRISGVVDGTAAEMPDSPHRALSLDVCNEFLRAAFTLQGLLGQEARSAALAAVGAQSGPRGDGTGSAS